MKLIDAEALEERMSKILNRIPADAIGPLPFFMQKCIEEVKGQPYVTLAVTQPSNGPLTLEELREMDGEPVWVFPADGFDLIPANYLVNASEEMVLDKCGIGLILTTAARLGWPTAGSRRRVICDEAL